MAEDIKESLEKLKSKDKAERHHAAFALRNAALHWEDVSQAAEAMEEAISDDDPSIRMGAAFVLATHKLQKGRIDDVRELYFKDDSGMRARVAHALGNAVSNGIDISSMVPSMEGDLHDRNLMVSIAYALSKFYLWNGMQEKCLELLRSDDPVLRGAAANECGCAASHGIEISPYLKALSERLEDADPIVALYAARSLTIYHAQRKNWKETENLLSHKSAVVRSGSLWQMSLLAKETTVSIDAGLLLKMLEDEEARVRLMVSIFLREAAGRGEDISFAVEALENACKDNDAKVREAAALALEIHRKPKEG